MGERGLPLKAHDIRALLAGRKTQHRVEIGVVLFTPEGQKPDAVGLHPFEVGDRLWVREAGNWRGPMKNQIGSGYIGFKFYAADSERGRCEFFDDKNKPSIHMPRWASRLTLTVTDVRVERLQDISREDTIAEGIEGLEDVWTGWHQPYAELWEKINGAGSWAANPWVVAISFSCERRNIDQVKNEPTAKTSINRSDP